MTLYQFQPVRSRVQHRGTCPSCGKGVIRRTIFENTVSPFNKNSDGTPKTYAQVAFDVKALAAAWEPDFRHNTESCRP